MRVKNIPQRRMRQSGVTVDGDVIPDSENGDWPKWEMSSRSVESPSNSSCQSYQDDCSAMCQALDLSMKSFHRNLDIGESTFPIETNARKDFQDTFLYKMLTDPMFIENIKRNKNPVDFPCQYCKQKFDSEKELAAHQNMPADKSNKIACCACDKTFAQKRYLRYHQRCHSDKNKFSCDICTKNYSRQDNLTRHNTLHTNPNKFPCNYCERYFARKDLLNKHVKAHENKFNFCCYVCQKYFKGALSLENHNKFYHSINSP